MRDMLKAAALGQRLNRIVTFGPVAAPMAGEDLFVSDKLLRTYVEGALTFFKEIADYFELHGADYF